MKSKIKIFTCGMLVLFLMISSVFYANIGNNKDAVQTSGSLELFEYFIKNEELYENKLSVIFLFLHHSIK